MQNHASFVTMLEHPSMLKRLFVELRGALRDFWQAPRSFITSAIKDCGLGQRRSPLFRLGLATALLFYAAVFASTIMFWVLNHSKTDTVRLPPTFVFTPLLYSPAAKMPDDHEKSGGGGGGGRNTEQPPSNGNLPTFALTNLVVAPRPEETPSPPALPFIETVKVDPRIRVERDDLVPTGLPDAASMLPSAGPGSDGGIGTGSRSGIGPGDGLGVGPGRDENIGGLRPSYGGRPREGTQHQDAVDVRPVLLNSPQPLFTEAARKNKVQGVVRVRILVDSTGAVREVFVLRGLPDGLSEQAIRAAYQMRFKPALKNGHPVPYWMNNVQVEFNLR